MRILITATSLIAGATASALTYSALSTTGAAATTLSRLGTTATSTLVGAGVTLIAGPITARIVQTAIETVGHGMVTPTVQSSSNMVALTASTAVGAIVVGSVALLGMALTYTWGKTVRLLRGRQPPMAVEARTIDDRTLDFLVIETLR
jgi:hypothetical protein